MMLLSQVPGQMFPCGSGMADGLAQVDEASCMQAESQTERFVLDENPLVAPRGAFEQRSANEPRHTDEAPAHDGIEWILADLVVRIRADHTNGSVEKIVHPALLAVDKIGLVTLKKTHHRRHGVRGQDVVGVEQAQIPPPAWRAPWFTRTDGPALSAFSRTVTLGHPAVLADRMFRDSSVEASSTNMYSTLKFPS